MKNNFADYMMQDTLELQYTLGIQYAHQFAPKKASRGFLPHQTPQQAFVTCQKTSKLGAIQLLVNFPTSALVLPILIVKDDV
jgi:hypothetical protein